MARRKLKNIQALSTHWGEPKVHVQVRPPRVRGFDDPNTPHGWVYGKETDDQVTCKHCLRMTRQQKKVQK